MREDRLRRLVEEAQLLRGRVEELERQLQAACAALRELELFRAAVENAPDGIQIVDYEGRILYSNRAVERIYGREPSELVGVHVNDLNVDPDLASRVILPSIVTTGSWAGDLMVKHKDGHHFPVWLTTSLVTSPSGEPLAMVGVVRDVSKIRRLQAELEALSLKDALTGLFNRRGFFLMAEQQRKLARRTGHGMLLVFADVDGLKAVNDEFGHQAGDAVLKGAAAILSACMRDSDIAARLGGDEFVVLQIEADPSELEGLQARVDAATQQHNEGAPHPVSISIGAAYYAPDEDTGVEALLTRADAKMYLQKRRKRAQRTASPRGDRDRG